MTLKQTIPHRSKSPEEPGRTHPLDQILQSEWVFCDNVCNYMRFNKCFLDPKAECQWEGVPLLAVDRGNSGRDQETPAVSLEWWVREVTEVYVCVLLFKSNVLFSLWAVPSWASSVRRGRRLCWVTSVLGPSCWGSARAAKRGPSPSPG